MKNLTIKRAAKKVKGFNQAQKNLLVLMLISQGGLRNAMNLTATVAPREVTRIIPGSAAVVGNDFAASSLPIQVTRNSYNIALFLPYFLFCVDAISTNYATVAADAGTLPAGVSMSVSIFQNKFVRFTFQSGAAVDTIDLSTQFPVPLPVIYEMFNTGDWFQGEGFQQTLGSNFNAQLNGVALSFGQLTFGGAKIANAIPMSNAKSPYQFQPNIIIVNRRIMINSRRYIGMAMADSAPGPGDNIIVNDFDVSMYHAQGDFTGEVVSSGRTSYGVPVNAIATIQA